MEDQHFIARLVKDDFHKMLITIIVFIALYFFYVNNELLVLIDKKYKMHDFLEIHFLVHLRHLIYSPKL